jgi:hypothetical protein
VKLDFGAISQKQQSTEPVSEVRHIILTSSQPVFVLSFQMIEKKNHNIYRWKSCSWLRTGTNMYQAVYRRMGSSPSAFLIIVNTEEEKKHVKTNNNTYLKQQNNKTTKTNDIT